MAMRYFVLAAALMPAAFAANATNATWNASSAADALLNGKAAVLTQISTAAGGSKSKLPNLAIPKLTAEASGPQVTGEMTLTMDSSDDALADPQFPRWIAAAIAAVADCPVHQVDVGVTKARRLTADGADRRLAATVNAKYVIYNPKRGRNIGLGVGLGLLAPAAGLGLGLGLGLDHGRPATTPEPKVPVAVVPTPVPAAPVTVSPTDAPSGSSMPLWAGILLGLAVLACIGAGVFLGTQKKEKKKRAVKKAAPVTEEVKVVEEVVPMLASPVLQTFQPAPTFQSVQYVQAPPTVAYAAPQFAAPGVQYASVSRAF